jgi:hypothetical protein
MRRRCDRGIDDAADGVTAVAGQPITIVALDNDDDPDDLIDPTTLTALPLVSAAEATAQVWASALASRTGSSGSDRAAGDVAARVENRARLEQAGDVGTAGAEILMMVPPGEQLGENLVVLGCPCRDHGSDGSDRLHAFNFGTIV